VNAVKKFGVPYGMENLSSSATISVSKINLLYRFRCLQQFISQSTEVTTCTKVLYHLQNLHFEYALDLTFLFILGINSLRHQMSCPCEGDLVCFL
jgi:hypothetical protein